MALLQRRTLYIKKLQAFDMLTERGIPTVDVQTIDQQKFIAISIDREARGASV